MRKRPFQFTLKARLGIVAILSVPLALFAWKLDDKRKERALVAQISQFGGHVQYDLRYRPAGAWLRAALGDDFFWAVTAVTLSSATTTDDALAPLRGLPRLRRLEIYDSTVTNDGLAWLEGLDQLESLSMYGPSKITDAGLVHLGHLRNLRWLDIRSKGITDAGLVHFRKLTALLRLDLRGTNVSEAGVAELRKALPACEITLGA